MQIIQGLLYGLAIILVLLGIYWLGRRNHRRTVHLVADAAFLAYAGYVGAGPLPEMRVILGGAGLVVVLLGLSGWLYRGEKRPASSLLAWLAALAVAAVTCAHYLGLLD